MILNWNSNFKGLWGASRSKEISKLLLFGIFTIRNLDFGNWTLYYFYYCHYFVLFTLNFAKVAFFKFILFLNFTILYWFCQISKWICHRYTCVPHPEPSSHLPPQTIPLGRPSAPAPSIQYRASNLDWRLVPYILYIFQCHSPKSSHPLPLAFEMSYLNYVPEKMYFFRDIFGRAGIINVWPMQLLCLLFFWCFLEILDDFWARNPAFSYCTRFNKLYNQSWSLVSVLS